MSSAARLRILILFIVVLSTISLGMTPEQDYIRYANQLGLSPVDYLASRAAENRLIMIGTRHRDRDIHQMIIRALPRLTRETGINTIFMEIASDQQPAIDDFSDGAGDLARIRVWDILDSPSYSAILLAARDLGIRIVAIDKPDGLAGTRDQWMSRTICEYLDKHPAARGLVIAGARHVMRDIRWAGCSEPSLADQLCPQGTFSVVVWPNAAAVSAIGVDTRNRSFNGIKDPTLHSMNIRPGCSLATTTDGVILLPAANDS